MASTPDPQAVSLTGAGSPAHVTVIVAATGTGVSSTSCSKRTLVP